MQSVLGQLARGGTERRAAALFGRVLAGDGVECGLDLKRHEVWVAFDKTDTSPMLSGGDVDAACDEAAVGEESVAGDNPTPDQSVVSELGEAMDITCNDNEPLHTEEKLLERDRHRWELDPASAEDFGKKIS